jgi:hypothetical protein
MDRYFLSKSNTFNFGNKGQVALFQLTFFLIGSKYHEIDDNITLIKDLKRYFTRILPT